MSENLESFKYSNIDILEGDFNAMVENCLSYNERDTIFFRAGVTMRDKGGAIIRQAKREIESIGFDPDSGKNIFVYLSKDLFRNGENTSPNHILFKIFSKIDWVGVWLFRLSGPP